MVQALEMNIETSLNIQNWYWYNDMFDNTTPEHVASENMEDRLYISSGSGMRWYSPGELEND